MVLGVGTVQGLSNVSSKAAEWIGEDLADCNPLPDLRMNKDIGETLYAFVKNGEAFIVSQGFYGYHPDEDPNMTVGVVVKETGEILSIAYLDQKAQTPGFVDMISQSYLDEVYNGKTLNEVKNVDVVSGATVTSQAIEYAVQTALIYANEAYSFGVDQGMLDLEEIRSFYGGQGAIYTPVSTSYVVDSKKYGTVLFAAENEHTLAMKIQSSTKFNYKHSSDTGWPAAEPNPYIMLIAIDKSSEKVVESKVLVDGTKRKEFFVVPDEKIMNYSQVEITDETVFDDYKEGLVFELQDISFSTDVYGYTVITGTSVIYTGASDDGTFSSQLIRHCFQTAARFFCNYETQ